MIPENILATEDVLVGRLMVCGGSCGGAAA